MDRNDLCWLDEVVYKQIQEDRRKKEAENKAYFDGMEKGAEMMFKAVKEHLKKEEQKGGEQG